MRILHVSEVVIGGVGSHLDEIIPIQLNKYGPQNVRLIIPQHEIKHLTKCVRNVAETFLHPSSRLQAIFSIQRQLIATFKKFKPDVVHVHSSFAGIATRLLRLVLTEKFQIVYCPHGWSFARDDSLAKRSIYVFAERLLSGLTDAIINVSNHERDLALAVGIPSEKLYVFRNGIAQYPPISTNKIPNLDPSRIHILFAGRFVRQKGIDILFEVAAQLEESNIQFHIIGGPAENNPLVPSSQIRCATFYGWKDRGFVLELIGKVDALIMPSRWEGLPIVGLEAMRAGKPIIASNRTALPEIVEHGVTGYLFDPAFPSELVGLLNSLEKNNLQYMGKNSKLIFEKDFTSIRQANDFDRLYNKISQ